MTQVKGGLFHDDVKSKTKLGPSLALEAGKTLQAMTVSVQVVRRASPRPTFLLHAGTEKKKMCAASSNSHSSSMKPSISKPTSNTLSSWVTSSDCLSWSATAVWPSTFSTNVIHLLWVERQRRQQNAKKSVSVNTL